MKTKVSLAKEYYQNGDLKKSLSIAKTFRIGDLTDLSNIKLAYDCIMNESFYKQIGKDIQKTLKDGEDSLLKILKLN